MRITKGKRREAKTNRDADAAWRRQTRNPEPKTQFVVKILCPPPNLILVGLSPILLSYYVLTLYNMPRNPGLII